MRAAGRLAALTIAATAGSALAGNHCHEVSDIVGRRKCSQFGAGWAHRVAANIVNPELGLVFERFAIPVVDATGTVSSSSSTASYHSTLTGSRRTMTTVGPRYWLGYHGPSFTIGAELTIGFALDAPGWVTQVDGFAPMTSSHNVTSDLGGVAGFHTRFGSFDLGAAVAIGMRGVEFAQNLPAGFTTCSGGATGKYCSLDLSEARFIVEPRLRGELWVHPQITVGVSVGVDVVGGGESIAATVAFHGSSFDGS